MRLHFDLQKYTVVSVCNYFLKYLCCKFAIDVYVLYTLYTFSRILTFQNGCWLRCTAAFRLHRFNFFHTNDNNLKILVQVKVKLLRILYELLHSKVLKYLHSNVISIFIIRLIIIKIYCKLRPNFFLRCEVGCPYFPPVFHSLSRTPSQLFTSLILLMLFLI